MNDIDIIFKSGPLMKYDKHFTIRISNNPSKIKMDYIQFMNENDIKTLKAMIDWRNVK